MDDFNTLSNRLLNRCPAAGIILARQFVNDSWHTLQAHREWSFRRRGGNFAPPNLYQDGTCTTNANTLTANAFLITGTGTNWTQAMVGRQIRIGGLLFPFYTITSVLSPTSLLIDQAWAGDDLVNAAYQIIQSFYVMPSDFGYFYIVTSIKDSYRLWLNLTEADLGLLDPQRTNYGQTYAVVFKDYVTLPGGSVGPVQANPISVPAGTSGPISTTTNGYNYPGQLTYILQITTPGTPAIFTWGRLGRTTTSTLLTSTDPTDLEFGVQVYWPDNGAGLTAGMEWMFTCSPGTAVGAPRYELWPAPTFSQYLYPYIYVAKEYDITTDKPQLPPFIANRGEVLLEMALQKCAEFPGSDEEHPNIYHDLRQAAYHGGRASDMLDGLCRNDEEVGVSLIDYENYPYYPAPWSDGQWQQTHAPFLR